MIRHSREALDERTTRKVSKDEHSLNFHIKHFLIIQKTELNDFCFKYESISSYNMIAHIYTIQRLNPYTQSCQEPVRSFESLII